MPCESGAFFIPKRPDYRSTEAQAYRHLYGSSRWRRMSEAHRRSEPLCRFCLKDGKVTPAAVCDHVVEHKGDENLFWHGELQSLCAPCHSSAKQLIEQRGFLPDVAADGFPSDPNHPFNRYRGA